MKKIIMALCAVVISTGVIASLTSVDATDIWTTKTMLLIRGNNVKGHVDVQIYDSNGVTHYVLSGSGTADEIFISKSDIN